jgi:hypothetical protein
VVILFTFLLLCFPDLTLGDLGFYRDFRHVSSPYLNLRRQEGTATATLLLEAAGIGSSLTTFLVTMVG